MAYQLTDSDIERTMSYISKSNDCWVWLGKPASTGYGQIGFGKRSERKTRNAHRVVYELLVGDIPEGKQLDHLCRNRMCVNPAHLEPVTQRENLLRGDTIPAKNSSKTNCIRGHKLTVDNTRDYAGRGGRQCKTCVYIRQKEHRQKQKEIA